MAIHVALRHVTHYTYDTAVGHGPHVIRLRPAPHCRTPILSYSQKITGGEHFLHWQQDPFSNWNARVVFPEPMREMKIEIEVVAEMAVYNPFDFFLEESASHYPFEYEAGLAKDLEPFLLRPASSPKLDALVAELIAQFRTAKSKGSENAVRTIDFVVGLNQRLQHSIRYLIRLEPGVQSAEETLTLGSGSCRDSAWLLVQLFRSMGVAARFVSGYLIQLAPDQKSLDGPSGTEVDFTDLHAWCEVYLPGGGWIGLDPTSGLLAGEGHIPLSCTPEPSTAAPVTGGIGKCESKLHHEMQVSRIYESPRVTRPYSEGQWAKIQSLGHRIDEDLVARDVRLTMGGEPTFVSVDDPDGDEWNFTAASPAKRVLSGTLLKRLRARMAPGSLPHYGQGKWYPGEPLPRWALSAFWRKDGVPIWKDDSLIADESKNYGHGAAEAGELIRRLARNLDTDPAHVLPAYEDLFYYTWKERRLPSNVSPTSSQWKNIQERERLARIFQRGLGEVVGYTLPLEVAGIHGGHIQWRSGAWFLRDGETLWLIPGDSAMGLRLPLDSIPWVADREYPWVLPQDPSAPLPPLPREFPRRDVHRPGGQAFVAGAPAARPPGTGPGQRAQAALAGRDPREGQAPGPGQSAPWIVRTALCVEPRDGRLHVFLPPVATTEAYLDLVSTLESTVSAMGVPVILEGEAPPRDPRINKLSVTPDPGVIEVNLHPSRTWEELVDRTTVLYEEARQTRLRAEKFMLDGRHSGTGGGNHIILGGETPGDSPILRRPDLLKSLLGYWQNHPSLSWLFSGLFVGPTSQAPRVDEARNDSLYELEIAFRELDRQVASHGPSVPPWLVDRLFRNLLIDSSGNTHRSEFSIDKLFAPESATGRLGLVEMRAFEMPPHAQMSLAQHLLLRGLVSTFWKKPYSQKLVRWGTDLHDRWMLPHFCETDFREVIRDLREAGYPFEMEWFAPQFEFRFPRIGDFSQRDVRVEIRSALEPWHVLGEENGGGGTVRYVDSSLERVQVKAQGLIGDRFALTVNGRRMPMHPTGTQGEAVAGVRYRAWQPPECLQPTIGVHAPLNFDLYDTWNERSIGGCTYHVTHPGGRNYETFPVNAYEAESRRLARFFATGATQGRFVPMPEPVNGDFPVTLDLRR
jgi:uncharacterized protein (DUF2126 family)/transglutaminase-like putative cysteine protease